MVAAIPELVIATQTLVAFLKLTNRAPHLREAMNQQLVEARGDPEPLKALQAPDLGVVEADVISDSTMIVHPAKSTPDATIVEGMVKKPEGFQYSAAGIHQHLKELVAVNASIDIAAQGGATTKNFSVS